MTISMGRRFRYHRKPRDRIDCPPSRRLWKSSCVGRTADPSAGDHDRIVYVGDGSSDIHVMLHVNRLDGLTIAVSENRYITQIARRTDLERRRLERVIPILEEIRGGIHADSRRSSIHMDSC